MLDEMVVERMIRPELLVEGEVYLLVEQVRKCNCSAAEARAVQFAGYTSCPGVVWVIEANGQRTRCLRERLFNSPAIPSQQFHP